jgi:hypothetical protein
LVPKSAGFEEIRQRLLPRKTRKFGSRSQEEGFQAKKNERSTEDYVR